MRKDLFKALETRCAPGKVFDCDSLMRGISEGMHDFDWKSYNHGYCIQWYADKMCSGIGNADVKSRIIFNMLPVFQMYRRVSSDLLGTGMEFQIFMYFGSRDANMDSLWINLIGFKGNEKVINCRNVEQDSKKSRVIQFLFGDDFSVYQQEKYQNRTEGSFRIGKKDGDGAMIVCNEKVGLPVICDSAVISKVK